MSELPKYNILYLHPVSKWIGGGETGLLDFLTNINRRKFEPVVIIPHKGPLFENLLNLNIKTYIMSFRRWESFETRLTLAFKIFSLIKMLKKERINLIHAHSHETTPFAILASKFIKIPVISHIRIQISREKAKKYLVHHADLVLTKSEWQREEISNIAKSTVLKIGDGFDFKKYDDANSIEKKTAIRNKLGIKEDALILISISRFEGRKNFELSLKAISSLKNKTIYLLLVGSKGDNNSYEEKVKRMIFDLDLHHNVKIMPFTNNVIDYLIVSDIFLQTSKKEGLSRAAIEAMFTGIPLIATNIPGNQDLIIDDQNGFLIKMDDPKQLTEKILLFYENRELIKKMGDAGRKIAIENFDIKKYNKRIEDIYLNFLEKKYSRYLNKEC